MTSVKLRRWCTFSHSHSIRWWEDLL